MKTFRELLEQINQIVSRQEKKELDKKYNLQYIKKQVTAGIRHRGHVHGEIARQAEAEQKQRKFSGAGE